MNSSAQLRSSRMVLISGRIPRKGLEDLCIYTDPQLDNKLGSRLQQQLADGRITSEQWYRDPDRWMRLSAMANPYQTIFDELPIIMKYRHQLAGILSEFQKKIFFGVGSCDSEIGLLRETSIAIHPESLSVYAIDVQRMYVQLFMQQLLNLGRHLSFKCKARPDIYFKGYAMLFEDLVRENFCSPPYNGQPLHAHILLGNVLGNFEDQDLLIKQAVALGADAIVVGVHIVRSMRELEYLYSLYRDNPFVEDFVRAPYDLAGGNPAKFHVELNRDEMTISGYIGDTRVCFSKKYDLDGLVEQMNGFGFEQEAQLVGEQSAICVFRRRIE